MKKIYVLEKFSEGYTVTPLSLFLGHFLMILSCLITSVWAEDLKDKSYHFRFDEFHLDVSYEKFFRLNTPVAKTEDGDWFNLDVRFENENAKTDLETRFYILEETDYAFSLKEMYYKKILFNETEFSFGRKILKWNENEKFWNLGYLNGLQSLSLLSDKEEGVTGLFLSTQWKSLEFDFFLSYVFIPVINPSIDIDNGKVSGNNDWVRLPPTQTIYNGRIIPISYQLSDINYSRIVFNKSLGGRVLLNYKIQGLPGTLSSYAFYKPENKLRINASAYYNTALDNVTVEANPTINHHAYYGLYLTQKFPHFFGAFEGGISYVDTNAKIGKDINVFKIDNSRQTFQSDFFSIEPNYEKESYAHASYHQEIFSNKFTLHYIHLLTNNQKKSDDFYSDAVRFKRALGLRADWHLFEKIIGFIDYKYDFHRRDTILNIESNYFLTKHWYISLGTELIKAETDESFWSYYRSNDIVYTKTGIIF